MRYCRSEGHGILSADRSNRGAAEGQWYFQASWRRWRPQADRCDALAGSNNARVEDTNPRPGLQQDQVLTLKAVEVAVSTFEGMHRAERLVPENPTKRPGRPQTSRERRTRKVAANLKVDAKRLQTEDSPECLHNGEEPPNNRPGLSMDLPSLISNGPATSSLPLQRGNSYPETCPLIEQNAEDHLSKEDYTCSCKKCCRLCSLKCNVTNISLQILVTWRIKRG